MAENARTSLQRSGSWRMSLSILLLIAMAIGASGLAWYIAQPRGDTGAHIIFQGDMTDEEAQGMIDRQAEQSRITVSLRPNQELVDGYLHVNFVVPTDNNGFAERLEIEQDSEVVYRSGVVEPEHVIEWAHVPRAHQGSATATVYAVNGAGADFGNPVSVDVEIAEG